MPKWSNKIGDHGECFIRIKHLNLPDLCLACCRQIQRKPGYDKAEKWNDLPAYNTDVEVDEPDYCWIRKRESVKVLEKSNPNDVYVIMTIKLCVQFMCNSNLNWFHKGCNVAHGTSHVSQICSWGKGHHYFNFIIQFRMSYHGDEKDSTTHLDIPIHSILQLY